MRLLLILALLLVVPSQLLWGQSIAPLLPEVDSLYLVAREAGHRAAAEPSTAGPLVLSFAGGVPFGLFGPLALAFQHPMFVGMGAAGAATVLITHQIASDPTFTLPPHLEQRIRHWPDASQQAFRIAYGERLSRRRSRASLWGGGLGTGTGLGLLAWAIWEISHMDF